MQSIDEEEEVVSSLTDPAKVEEKINADFKKYNDAIARASVRVPAPANNDKRDPR
jgi:hypothetical protein